MRVARAAIAALAVLSVALVGSAQHGEASGFHIERFYNGNGQYCTGLFNDRNQLLSYWDCSGAMGSMRKAAL